MTWTRFLETANADDHAVQIYHEVDELAASLAQFLGGGFQVAEPAIVITTPEHWQVFRQQLEAAGCRVEELQRQGLLTCRDADLMLSSIMDGELPSASAFEQVVGGLLDETSRRYPSKTIRTFGEMVDVLWRRGQEQAAIALEELWNELAGTRSFALFCGYQLDIFDAGVQAAALPRIFGKHSHQRLVADTSRLADAVDRALADVVGPVEAGRIYLQVAEEMPLTAAPRGQVILMWLSDRQEPKLERILKSARAHYANLGERHTFAA
ncbi:MAG TPA: MEDS domain-containing protein [Gaiellaceae bacterium]|nr:MEDS domain-containing protein [Gaiellaceae bacterium]